MTTIPSARWQVKIDVRAQIQIDLISTGKKSAVILINGSQWEMLQGVPLFLDIPFQSERRDALQ